VTLTENELETEQKQNMFREHTFFVIRSSCLFLALFFVGGSWAAPQDTPQRVSVQVDADKPEDSLPPVWAFFGYDEPNYTYATNGTRLLRELAALSPVPVYIRTHNLFTSGDGSASLKWGSTNVYTEDASGNPFYDWKIVDRIFDTLRETGVKPIVELGFMPEALSTHPQPYRHNFPSGPVGGIYTGWAYPPKDYGKWAELVFEFVKHLRGRYGDEALNSWLWEVWNEPDIGYWQGTPEEYFKLYDFSVDAVLRVFPAARIGGPETTGAGNPKAAEFLRLFLEHCTHGKNYVTGKTGTRLDFISFHPKGSPRWTGDHVQMGLSTQLRSIQKGFEIVASNPEWSQTPIILGEWDPEGCAACSAQQNPQNSYRNGPLYACYTAEALSRTLSLAKDEHIVLQGLVTWAFEFEGQPYFAGFRELSTNGIDKPVLNAFRMFGLLGPERVAAVSSGALQTGEIVQSGVRGPADVDVLASRNEREIAILIWNYHDDDLPAPATPINASVRGLPKSTVRVSVEQFRIDADHSNSYSEWKEMGAPQSLTSAEQEKIQAAGQLQLVASPTWEFVENGLVRLQLSLSRQGLSLIRIYW
jgi:xylan 1,4-beta-xylosidase